MNPYKPRMRLNSINLYFDGFHRRLGLGSSGIEAVLPVACPGRQLEMVALARARTLPEVCHQAPLISGLPVILGGRWLSIHRRGEVDSPTKVTVKVCDTNEWKLGAHEEAVLAACTAFLVAIPCLANISAIGASGGVCFRVQALPKLCDPNVRLI